MVAKNNHLTPDSKGHYYSHKKHVIVILYGTYNIKKRQNKDFGAFLKIEITRYTWSTTNDLRYY